MTDDPTISYTVQDIAKLLKLNPQTIRNWINAGTLPAYRAGRLVRIRRSDFNAFIDAGTRPTRADPRSARRVCGTDVADAFWMDHRSPTQSSPDSHTRTPSRRGAI